MIGLLRRAPAMRAGRPNRAFLRLESLDGRAAPSGGTTPNSTPPYVAPAQEDTVNAAPQIVNFQAIQNPDGTFSITGQVIDEDPGGLVVRFSGDVATLDGQSATTNADGYFFLRVNLQTNGTDTGWLYAQTTDRGGLVSNEASVYCLPTSR